mmetsp:Transcript_13203/g.18695  ORF Transcript_13203/g.18695 Transcript_13203/m.18695 type:complete len:324 (+) Transcript_13203:167-1138(+)
MKNLLIGCFLVQYAAGFTSPNFVTRTMPFRTTSALAMATVPPSSSSTVGVVGAGFMSVLTAKLAALSGYETWMIFPDGEEENVRSLIGDEIPSNLEIVPASDDEKWEAKLSTTDAVVVAVDSDVPMNENSLKYLVNPTIAPNLKRVVAMSRNLNGKEMGFLVKASKMSANMEVWDGSTAADYKKFEQVLKEQAEACGADYTIARAGTLKGGACGESEFKQYLSPKYYDMTKKDIVTWQLLFDCKTRGVTLAKGDVMPGPGGKAVFTATSDAASPGDTGRCGLAEAMVRSLSLESAANVDFGVGTAESRTPPSDTEWGEIFSVL